MVTSFVIFMVLKYGKKRSESQAKFLLINLKAIEKRASNIFFKKDGKFLKNFGLILRGHFSM
jgi:hypothetical protein